MMRKSMGIQFSLRFFKCLATILLLVAVIPSQSKAQDAEEEIEMGKWYNTLVARVAGSQVGFHNWQGGGVNSLSGSIGLDGRAQKTVENLKQTHELKLGLGGISQNDEQLRKAEDIIAASTTWEYIGQGFFSSWHPTFSAGLLTQFLDGFDYSAEPKVRVSGFFSPGYLTESIGLTRQITPHLSQRFGVASKQTIVSEEAFRVRYGNELDETVRIEAGLESRTDFQKDVAENVTYKSSLGIFAGLTDFGHPDITWSNLIAMKVNNWLNVNLEWVTLYDNDVLDKIQFREGVSVGASFNLK